MKKKSIIIIIILCLITLISVTYAYIVRETNTSSIITFGSLKMELIETTIKDGQEVNRFSGYRTKEEIMERIMKYM